MLGDGVEGPSCVACTFANAKSSFSWYADMVRTVSPNIECSAIKKHLASYAHNRDVLSQDYWKKKWNQLKEQSIVKEWRKLNIVNLQEHLSTEDKVKLKNELS